MGENGSKGKRKREKNKEGGGKGEQTVVRREKNKKGKGKEEVEERRTRRTEGVSQHRNPGCKTEEN